MVRIFVEGKEDKFFIEFIIQLFFEGTSTIEEVISTGGFTKIDKVRNKFLETTDSGGVNLVIFDADDEYNNGGFEVRRDFLTQKKRELSIEFESFLFPNNQGNGMLETLLLSIVNEDHQRVLDCFESYEECLSQYNENEGTQYELPIIKSKVFAYLDVFPKSNRQKDLLKDGNLLFDQPSIWNFNHDTLLPLREFLSNYITS